MELRNNNNKEALDLARNSTRKVALPPTSSLPGYYQHALVRNVTLWSLCVDLEESFGTMVTLKACYERMFDLKVVTPSHILTYTSYLEENKFWEESFRVYERAVALLRWPHVYDVWVMYLMKFVSRYGGRKLERARELFEQVHILMLLRIFL